MAREGVLIDTGGLDKFFEPDTPRLIRYWRSFGPKPIHFITPVVYWEFLHGLDVHAVVRRRFFTAIDRGILKVLPFDLDEAKKAVEIYRNLHAIIDEIPKSKKRARLEPLQCDVFIAATAHCHLKRVFTMDSADWEYIQMAIEDFSIQALQIDFGKDFERAGKRTPGGD